MLEHDTCPGCGAARPATARFCSSCGRDLQGAVDPVASELDSPRLFGVLSPTAAFVLACVLLLGAIVAGLAASLIPAILLLALAGAAFVLFFEAAEDDSSSRIARGAGVAKDRIRGWTSFTASSAGAWTRAGREVVRLRGELGKLRAERGRLQLALGDAAYREDESAVAELRGRMQELDRQIALHEAARSDAMVRARSRVAEERVAVHHTEVIAPADGDSRSGPAER